MDNSITEKSPAKINLFLKILNRREDNYHNIRTGITSINLCDEIEVKPSDQFNVNYKGPFAPENNKFDDCIIKKIFSFLNIHFWQQALELAEPEDEIEENVKIKLEKFNG